MTLPSTDNENKLARNNTRISTMKLLLATTALIVIPGWAEAESSAEAEDKSLDANANTNLILGMVEKARKLKKEQQVFPMGPCDGMLLSATFSGVAYDGQSCHKLCEHFNLLTDSNGTRPERELECSYEGTRETSQTPIYKDAMFLRFDDCQIRLPEHEAFKHTQCMCGSEDKDETQQVVVCDSDYYLSIEGASHRPPLECTSLNITDLNLCIGVATSYNG